MAVTTTLIFNKVTRCSSFKINRKFFFLKRRPSNQTSSLLFHSGTVSKNTKLDNVAEKNHLNFLYKSNILCHYRQYLLNNSEMYPSVFTPEKWPQSTSSKTIKFLNEMEINSCSEKNKEKLKVYLDEELTSFTYSELLEVLNLLVTKNLINKKEHWPDVIQSLDNELFRRKKNLSVDDTLRITDILYDSKSFFEFNFTFNRVSKYCRKRNDLTDKQIVHLLFLLTKFKAFPIKEHKFLFQELLDNVVPSLNCQEVGIISFGIYKMRLCISHSTLFFKITSQALSEVTTLNSCILNSISLAFLHCSTKNLEENAMQFQEKMIPYIKKYDLGTLTNLVCCNLMNKSVHQNLFYEILKHAKENIEKCTSFTFSRFAYMCAKFNFKDEEFLKMAAASFRKLEKYNPSHLTMFLKFSLCMGIYEKDLLTKVFCDKFAENLIARKSYLPASDVCYISGLLELERPEIEGLSKLSEANSNKILKMKITCEKTNKKYIFLPKKHTYESNLLESALLDLYGSECVAWMKPLFQYPAGYFVKFDKNLKAQPISEESKKCNKRLLRPPADNHFWVTFLIINNYNYGFYNDLDFITQTQIKHFELAGYTPIKVNFFNQCLYKEKDMRIQYIKNLVTTTLEDDLKKSLNSIKDACVE